jgi:hypothetical protein
MSGREKLPRIDTIQSTLLSAMDSAPLTDAVDKNKPMSGAAIEISLVSVEAIRGGWLVTLSFTDNPLVFLSDPPSFQWTPMLGFWAWRGVSDEYREAPGFSGVFQA